MGLAIGASNEIGIFYIWTTGRPPFALTKEQYLRLVRYNKDFSDAVRYTSATFFIFRSSSFWLQFQNGTWKSSLPEVILIFTVYFCQLSNFWPGVKINSQSFEDTQVGYICKNTLLMNTLWNDHLSLYIHFRAFKP